MGDEMRASRISAHAVRTANVFALLASAIAFVSPASALAYSLKNATADGCGGDGSECVVYCNNGQRAGSMYWNGSVWTDGVKWDQNREAEAEKICAANGSDCI
jgi:hypothetical protein